MRKKYGIGVEARIIVRVKVVLDGKDSALQLESKAANFAREVNARLRMVNRSHLVFTIIAGASICLNVAR
jgi:hypothetical protein